MTTEETMKEEQLLYLVDAIDEVGVLPSAKEDARNRAKVYFQEQLFDRSEARGWAHRLRQEAPHLFGQAASTNAATPASTVRAAPPPPLALSAAQLKALEGLSPVDRLTRYREMQQRSKDLLS
jgi:hypothetical protein